MECGDYINAQPANDNLPPATPESTPQGKVSEGTVTLDFRKVMKKLQVINRTELAYSRVAAVV